MLKLWLLLGCFSTELFLRVSSSVVPMPKTRNYPNCFMLQDDSCPNANITFLLYTPTNTLGSPLTAIDFDFQYNTRGPLKVLIHGYDGSRQTSPNSELLPPLLSLGNLNIITVDYANLVPDPCYTEAVHNAPYVGRCVAQLLLNILRSGKVIESELHLIGFGIGAHVAGFASDFLQRETYRVEHITALDPAKPLYLTPNLSKRIDPSDANFVDVIHTDVFLHGLMQPVGHVDFYPNKGVVQPNCGSIAEYSTHQCYHIRAAQYYAESIDPTNKFIGFRCDDLYTFIINGCSPNTDFQPLGYYTPATARGNYFLSTNDKSPYAKGMDFENLDRTLYGKTYLGDALVQKLHEQGGEFRNLTVYIG